ncbi:hypothetical protein BKM31_44300 [[Actinomadura] parvosata subsp. kistnae]|uniref:wHTH-Hsp90 Na associated domain-containing protein n=1 Tax=[Actinomadura] parvosata subsp. kistnae TaxID=1909395 RepID=A0A1V0ABH9_9ACTN|nr:hypothetical protein BKM31_44300 [Nonomuraea sp. ATCC 55076]
MEMSVLDARSALISLEDRGLLQLPQITATTDMTPNADVVEFIKWALQTLHPGTRRQEFTRAEPCLAVAALLSGRYWRRGAVCQLKKLIPYTIPEGEITYVHLVRLASMITGTIGDARRLLSSTYPDVSLPAATQHSESLQPWLLSAYLVTPFWSWKSPSWAVNAGQIVDGTLDFGITVGDFLRQLAPYRELGAPIPELGQDAFAEMAGWRPDQYDIDMLALPQANPFLNDVDYATEIDGLRLVQIAGRLGMNLTEAHRRLNRMAPLGLQLRYVSDAVPDEIVLWQDLLLLTVHLDGQHPVISGHVDLGHCRRAAEETQEPVMRLFDRLRIYAPLFSLTLPQEPVDV